MTTPEQIDAAKALSDKSQEFKYGDFTSIESAEKWRDCVVGLLTTIEQLQQENAELRQGYTDILDVCLRNRPKPTIHELERLLDDGPQNSETHNAEFEQP